MKKLLPHLLLLSMVVVSLSGKGQATEKMYRTKQAYFSTEGEMIFSFANIESDTMSIDNIMRWAPVFNLTGHLNYDVSKHFGLDMGLGFQNVGFIAKFPDADNGLKKKYRTYTLGVPIGFKLGDLNQERPFFLFAGYEMELPFSYKEKTFNDGDKVDKITGWFSDRTETFQQALYAGVQFPQGFSLKFKYYLTNFFNQDYESTSDGVTTKPYAGYDVNVFYFSLSWFPFQDSKYYDIPFVDSRSTGTVTSANW